MYIEKTLINVKNNDLKKLDENNIDYRLIDPLNKNKDFDYTTISVFEEDIVFIRDIVDFEYCL